MIFSGSWAHCWMEYGHDTDKAIKDALDMGADSQLVLIVLNTTGFGGCGGGGRAHVTLGGGGMWLRTSLGMASADWRTNIASMGHTPVASRIR